MLTKELKAAINKELDLCKPEHTPIICGMLENEKARELLIIEVSKRMVARNMEIGRAIVDIDDEFNPNSLW